MGQYPNGVQNSWNSSHYRKAQTLRSCALAGCTRFRFFSFMGISLEQISTQNHGVSDTLFEKIEKIFVDILSREGPTRSWIRFSDARPGGGHPLSKDGPSVHNINPLTTCRAVRTKPPLPRGCGAGRPALSGPPAAGHLHPRQSLNSLEARSGLVEGRSQGPSCKGINATLAAAGAKRARLAG